MKLLALLIAAPLLAQVAPDCTYTLQHAPGGSIIVHRNGTALQELDYTRSGAGGLRTVALNGWNDGDLIMIYYFYGVGTPIPGTTPPSKITIYLPTKEYKTCVGTQNPPAPPPFVPYTGATQDVDLGQHVLHALRIQTGNPPDPSRIWLKAGTAPTDTVVNGIVQDAVLYMDAADNSMKVLRKDGTVQPPFAFPVSLSLTQPTGAIAGATVTVPLNLLGTTQPAGVQWTIVYDPAVITSLAVGPGLAATAAAKTISCAGATGTMTCLATGINMNTIAPGVLALLTMTISPTAVSGSQFGLGLTNPLSASLTENGIPTGGIGISVLVGTTPATARVKIQLIP